MREFYSKNKPLIILWLLCVVAFIVFMGHYSTILLDVGREAYYPQRILEGKVLYKDLFTIYGPLSYLLNAFLYKILGTNLSTLYFSGAVCSLAVVSGIYLIAKKFLTPCMSFALAFFTIITGVCADHLFNFTFPYSWAMLYGLVGFLYSLYFLLKFRETETSKYLYLSGLLAGFAAVNKYEFIPFAVFLFILALLTKNRVYILNFLVSFLVFPVLSFGILFLQGMRLEHLFAAVKEVAKISNAQTLKFFYTNQGIFFTTEMLPIWLKSFLLTSIPFALLLLSYKLYEKRRMLSIIAMMIVSAVVFITTTPTEFVFMLPLLLLLSVCGIMKIKNNELLLILIFATFTISAKSFFGLVPLNYGNYSIAIVLTTFFAVLFCLLNKKYQKPAAIFLTVVGLSFLAMFAVKRVSLKGKISSPHGVIYTSQGHADAANEVLSFLNNDEYKDAKALIYPEGLLLNFLSKNSVKSDDFYNSFIPLYYETIGEEKFVNFVKDTKPEFVIFNSQSMADYYFETVCSNYGFYLCGNVRENYSSVKLIDHGIQYEIFQLKKDKF